MPRYLVTYCAMDGEAGANPFWHAALMLSKQELETAPITVEDVVGYYSQPSSTTNPVIRSIKSLLGFGIDLQGGHGVLQREQMRYLYGNGLHGVTFEVTEEQFNNLIALYNARMATETAAIQESNAALERERRPINGHTRFIWEKARAVAESAATQTPVEPRLRPFEIDIRVNSSGIDTRRSYACKNYALALLLQTNIIDKTTHDAMLGGPAKHAFPRFGGVALQPFRLVSNGEPEHSPNSSGNYFYNRTWGRNKLYWAMPPYMYGNPLPKAELAAVQNEFQIKKNILTRTREVELMLRHKIRELPVESRRELETQLGRVIALYETFRVEGEKPTLRELSAKALEAEKTLNIATLSVTPEQVNYSFMLRAMESLAVRNGLIALIVLVIAAAFISTPVGAVAVSVAGLYAGYQAARFFQEDAKFTKMRADFRAYHAPKELAGVDVDAGTETSGLITASA